MSSADEKRVRHLAERKGYQLVKVGKGMHRFYIIESTTGGKMPSEVPGHQYSFSLEEANAWLAARDDKGK
jgi:hypothetical protein